MNKDANFFLSGKGIYGDNFNEKELIRWYEDEKEGYSGLVKVKDYDYPYNLINIFYGYSKIKNKKYFDNVLGFGSALGEEFNPIIDKINKITIIEPSDNLISRNKKIKYVKPNINGKLNFQDNTFDLITCFGVLHHIANVSTTLKEMKRVLKPGGYMLIREPIISMGDWTKKRKGLTKRERGFPIDLFQDIILKNNLKIISKEKMLFPLLMRLRFKSLRGYNYKLFIWIDYILSKAFSWNYHYHSTNKFQKIQPIVYFMY